MSLTKEKTSMKANLARKAFERAQAEWYREWMAESQLLIGMILYQENRMNDARIFFRRSYSLYDELKSDEGVFKALFHMGLVRHALDNLVKARSIFLECLERTSEEDIAIIADLHLRLALITQNLKRPSTLFFILSPRSHYRSHILCIEMVWRILFHQRNLGTRTIFQHLDLHEEQEPQKVLPFFRSKKRNQEKKPPKPTPSKVPKAEAAPKKESTSSSPKQHLPKAPENTRVYHPKDYPSRGDTPLNASSLWSKSIFPKKKKSKKTR